MKHFTFDEMRSITPEAAANEIQNGWLIQYRGAAGIVSNAIRWASSGQPHTHSALAHVFENGKKNVNVLEMREFRGGRSLPFEYHVEKFGGRMDVFSLNKDRFPVYDANGTIEVMRDLVTRGYGYDNVAALALRHLPFIWRFFPVDITDVLNPNELKNVRPFCSHAIAFAMQLGGNVDPVLRLPAYLVEPSHLTNSHCFNYEFTVQKKRK